MRCYTFYVTALINVRVLSSSSTGCWRSLSMSYSSSLGLVETSCSGSAWYVKNYCFHKSKNFVGFMRRGGNDFLSVTIDLWSRPPVAVISARAAINSLGKPAKAKFVWARTEVRRLIKSSHQMLVKGRLAKLMIYFLQLIFNVRVHNGGFWQFTFDEVHCNHDSQNSFSALILSPRHENKLAPPPPPPPPPG